MLAPFSWMAVRAFSVPAVILPDAVAYEIPVRDPVFVTPPPLLLIPPVMDAPPLVTVSAPATV